MRQADVAGLDVVVERPEARQRQARRVFPDDCQRVVERVMSIGLPDQVSDVVRDGLEELLAGPLLRGELVGVALRELWVVAFEEPMPRSLQVADRPDAAPL